MAGQIGVFQHMLSEHDAIVELDWMGRMVPAKFDERDLIDGAHRKKKRRKRYPGHRTLELAAVAA